ncbi:methyl-accepting chemotaxis proteins (MCP)-glutamate methylesterase [Oceanobacillus iheyensis HTE831]|uniref:Protein-glutamate methylesterase/protein-glutamine glutaminase n=1 Tax=Oceanobacillus iheyensis (strain DSM 14371 / CIP 107618 / JCM 11309 / KCTC 3954 / HTE831) TaxID=221109 RepID=CHEB_OCEIH|nr:chemotaxis response regulator protein-glutamate methylesterase [Oceanobacillus iheyensis]Q8EQW0.1 RecName: Full=Protein-glutamate methylesterase/protein-glutamine glutaminase [Oceanobacillus iheyensis HTE831]BAC13534.1 methyl-accepting chemotaxis proteins (MCP)-glutamate methylesterase [Oceanobacillus iheyensis HTE831]
MRKVRAIVIDDSAFMRKIISDILDNDPRIEVVAVARNGEDGLNKVIQLSPDVVTLDVHMPKMDGMQALQRIMNEHPVPVVMLSSVTKAGAEKTIQAISNGAVDFIMKPSGSISLDIRNVEDEIRKKVILASTVRVKSTQEASEEDFQSTRTVPTINREKKYRRSIVSIGTSTGGPKALQKVLTELPKDIQAPIVIVQHMPPGFTKSLADRLNSICAISVKEAVHGEILQSGTAYIAPGGFHMQVENVGMSLAIALDKSPPLKGHRPSVNKLFSSLQHIKNYNKITCILTGMGNDGTDGLQQLRLNEGSTISLAESADTAIVYGMPKAAVNAGLIDYEMSLHEIPSLIVKQLT